MEKEELKKYKQNRKLIEVTCDCCGVTFEKPKSEFDRNVKLGRRNFCSRSCCGKMPKLNPSPKSKSPENIAQLKTICGNRRDEFTPFRYLLASAKRRFKEFDITLTDLKEQWELQDGICPYSYLNLLLPESSNTQKDSIYRASLDRIDSELGYVKGNIQFISTPINYMKSTMSDSDIKSFITLLVKNHTPFPETL